MSQSSGEKTEQPTEKRLRDARRKGQVSKSQDLSSAALLLVAVSVVALTGAHTVRRLADAMRDGIFYAASFRGELDKAMVLAQLSASLATLALALAPLIAATTVTAILVNYLQVKSVFAVESLKPNLSKLNPAQGFQEKFLKSRPYVELVKTLLKMIVAAVVSGGVLWAARTDIVNLTSRSASEVMAFTSGVMMEVGLKVGLAFLVLGAADFFLQKMLFLKDMKMTKQEVREEYKETEGNPLIKSARRQIHHEILSQSTAAAVMKADVVLANPTHVAVALQYDRTRMNAPIVVAKGADLMAAQIRRIAEEANVEIVRDVPLARALYEMDIDTEISEDLYEAVAIVLRLVYDIAEKRGEVGARHA